MIIVIIYNSLNNSDFTKIVLNCALDRWNFAYYEFAY